MDDSEVPPFEEPPICTYIYIYIHFGDYCNQSDIIYIHLVHLVHWKYSWNNLNLYMLLMERNIMN